MRSNDICLSSGRLSLFMLLMILLYMLGVGNAYELNDIVDTKQRILVDVWWLKNVNLNKTIHMIFTEKKVYSENISSM